MACWVIVRHGVNVGVLLRLKKIGRAGGTRYEGTIIQVAMVGCRVGKRSAPTARFRGRVDGKYATAVTSFRSPLRRVYMCVFLTRTCKGGSPPPPLQSRLPAENRPCGEAAPYSLRPRVGHDNTSLYCHALAPLTRPIPGPRPFGANASRCSKMLPAFLSFRCAPACGETARPIFFSRSKTLRFDV